MRCMKSPSPRIASTPALSGISLTAVNPEKLRGNSASGLCTGTKYPCETLWAARAKAATITRAMAQRLSRMCHLPHTTRCINALQQPVGGEKQRQRSKEMQPAVELMEETFGAG